MPANRRRGQYERGVGGVGRLVPHARRHTLDIADAHHVALRAEWQSWALAAGVVLDAAALAACSLETGDVEDAKICVRTGTRALLAIADALGRASPATEQGRSRPGREKYEAALARLSAAG